MKTPDLLSLVVEIQPLEERNSNALPQWWGRAVHWLLLEAVKEQDATLAKSLHDSESGPQPFTASSLLGYTVKEGLDQEKTYTLRLTALNSDIAAALIAAAEAGMLSPGNSIDVDRIPFRVQAVHRDRESHSWAGSISYQDLGASHLISSTPPEDQIRLHFASPTAFKSHGKQIIIPLSDFVFRSLLRKWNKFASLKFDEAVKNYVNRHVTIKRYELHSRSIQYREKGYRFGGLGFVTYELLKDDRYWMAVLHVLAQYALFAGVGRGTTMGFGQCQTFSREQNGNDKNN